MRALSLPCRVVLAGVLGAVLAGCAEQARVEGFTATGPDSFLYEARTNTVMTPNDDGVAERLRRSWIADAVLVNALCTQGYVIERRSYIQDPVGNSGAIRYTGRCLAP
jgi:hypothetical protein